MARQLLRSIVSSLLAFVVDFSLLFFLVEFLSVYYLISASLSFIAGTSITYFLSITWIFEKRTLDDPRQEYIIFFVIGLIGLGLNVLLIWYFTESMGNHYLLSKIISSLLIFFFNFFVRKFTLFR